MSDTTKFSLDLSLDEKIRNVQQQVAKSPTDGQLRIYLYQLHALVGCWDKALRQLQAAEQFDLAAAPMAKLYRDVIKCEMVREEVFSGTRLPDFIGDPPSWISLVCEALVLVSKGDFAKAAELRVIAYSQIPSAKGTINGDPFDWMADADTRIGPVFEAFVDAQYVWLSVDSLKTVRFDPPTDLQDLIWATAYLELKSGAKHSAFVPVRYVQSTNGNDLLATSRLTEWKEAAEDTWIGHGQRQLATDQDDYAILEVRSMSFSSCE